MASGCFRFEKFSLDPGERLLKRDDVTVELNARYFDALALLVRDHGRLVSKDSFLAEVWHGIPVTDEAVTQCIKTLRRQLGDSASDPRFIETIPKHGYRFIAPVEWAEAEAHGQAPARLPLPQRNQDWSRLVLLGAAGTAGGGFAGLLGGLVYGFAGAAQPLEPGTGASSVLLVMVALSVLIGLIGAAGVAFGIAATGLAPGRNSQWSILGGAAGGLVVGAIVKLLGLDAIALMFGRSPGDFTGGPEGAVLGAAVGLGVWLGSRHRKALALRRSVAAASATGAAAGAAIVLLGGRLMGGSLDLLARQFPSSRLRLDQIGSLFGEQGFGSISKVATGALEGMLFAGCVVAAMIMTDRGLGTSGSGSLRG